MNPFAKHDSHSDRAVISYKVFTTLSWLLSLVASFYYVLYDPKDGHHIRRRIWDQNYLYYSAFTMNSTIASIYWAVLFFFQAGYISTLFSSKLERRNEACSVGSHFILNNLLHFGFVMLFVRSHFFWAEVLIIINFFNLTSLYFRHNTYARYIHYPAVSGPLAWTFVAIYWNGAIMVRHPEHLPARIVGNVFIWSILAYGLFYIFVYKDYTMGFNLSVLTAAIGVAQFFRQIVAFQWIFAFTIMAVLFVFTLIVAVPAATGRDFNWRRREVDAERAPLLADN